MGCINARQKRLVWKCNPSAGWSNGHPPGALCGGGRTSGSKLHAATNALKLSTHLQLTSRVCFWHRIRGGGHFDTVFDTRTVVGSVRFLLLFAVPCSAGYDFCTLNGVKSNAGTLISTAAAQQHFHTAHARRSILIGNLLQPTPNYPSLLLALCFCTFMQHRVCCLHSVQFLCSSVVVASCPLVPDFQRELQHGRKGFRRYRTQPTQNHNPPLFWALWCWGDS